MKKQMSDEAKTALKAAKVEWKGMLKTKVPEGINDVTEWKARIAKEYTGYKGVWYREVDGIKEYYVRGRVKSSGEEFFEPADRPGHPAKTASQANAIRSKLIAGSIDTNPKRREKAEEAKVAEAGKWTFNRLWEAWQADPENVGKRGTIKADQKYRKHLKVPFGEKEPSSLKPIDIDRLRLSLAKDHAKATVISILGLIRRIERYGASTGRCVGLPFPVTLRGKALGRDPEVKRAPTDEQVDGFIKTCESWPDPQEGAFMLLIAATGMRRSSARNLKWEDIDLDNATAVLKDSKTGDVQIVLGDDAVALLRSHAGEIESPYIFTGKGWEPLLDKEENPIMHKKNGRMRRMQTSKSLPQLTQRQIDRVPREIADAAGLPKDLDPCHSFRRRLATKVEEKFGIATAMRAGGWKSPAMVLNYTATTKQTVRDAVNLLNRKTETAS